MYAATSIAFDRATVARNVASIIKACFDEHAEIGPVGCRLAIRPAPHPRIDIDVAGRRLASVWVIGRDAYSVALGPLGDDPADLLAFDSATRLVEYLAAEAAMSL